ncbi:MAG TPA: hypothetical protein VMY59_10470 [Candidatus Thermoplasmatota archaeon]|nr:hypothetical protein [Candidatus Thermoplasmatota archaeon]
MNKPGEYGFETDFESFPFGELKEFQDRNKFIWEAVQLRKPSLKDLNAAQYLSSVESYISEELVSPQNYTEIKKLASYFNERITSFFGFETRLNNCDGQSDYLFAVSSLREEREKLAGLFTHGKLPQSFRSKKEWQNIEKFVTTWTDPHSILYNNIRGLWFEFDIVGDRSQVPIPCVFLHTVPLSINNSESTQECTWLTHFALPLLIGQPLSQNVERNTMEAIQRLPEAVTVFQVGVMLSRATAGVRLVLNKIKPAQIIPYLKTLGWSENDDRLSSLIKELEHYVTSIVLHINIGEKGVDPKIGLECSFYPHLYNFETKWSVFLNYLVKNGLCRPEKKNALLHLPGAEREDMTDDFNLKSYVTNTRLLDNDFSSALVRYISHIKLVYMPDHPIEAKVYSGVRLFRSPAGQQRNHHKELIEYNKELVTHGKNIV